MFLYPHSPKEAREILAELAGKGHSPYQIALLCTVNSPNAVAVVLVCQVFSIETIYFWIVIQFV